MGVLVSRLIQLQVVTVGCLTISDKRGSGYITFEVWH